MNICDQNLHLIFFFTLNDFIKDPGGKLLLWWVL